ncbi:MAG: cytochrome c peroxidase [Gammaproteobacteria bacterium]
MKKHNMSFYFLIISLISTAGMAAELTPTEQLGKSIFFDETLSINQNQSCAACHAPDVGWTGPSGEF